MANIPISSLPSVNPTGYTNQDLLVVVNYQLPSGTTSNTPLSALTSYVLSAFTGNTSATCISDLYVTNLYGCSPITVNNDLILNYPISAGTNSDDILVRENTGYVKSIPISGLPFSNVTGLTFNNATYDLTVSSDNGSAYTQSLYILAGDMTVTGGTYNPGTGDATFTTNSGGTFTVSGFLTGYTDTNIYTVDGSLTGNRLVDLNGYSLTFNDNIIVNTVYIGRGLSGPNISMGDISTLSSNISGLNNIAIGNGTLSLNDIGSDNVSVGHQNLASNQLGNYNVSLGNQSLISNFLGSSNTSVGHQSLYYNTNGFSNTSVGYQAGYDLQTGGNNIFIGVNSGGGIVGGNFNTVIGSNVSGLAPSLSNNIIIADGQGNQRINVVSNGDVGIGTTTPSYKLDVNGDGRFSGDSLTVFPLRLDGTNSFGSSIGLFQTDVSINRNSFAFVGTTSAAMGWGVNFNSGVPEKVYISNMSGIDIFNFMENGNMGIGVSSPSDKLEVSGKTKTTNFQMTSGATNGYVLTSDASGNASWQSPSGLSEYTLTFMGTSLNPGDGVTYYVGATANAPFTTDTNVQHIVPKTGTITKVAITSRQTAGSSQTSTFSVGINGVYTQISNAVLFNAIRTNSLSTGLNIPVSQGDLLTIRWLCPTWTPTNPTGVILNVTLFIQ